MMQLHTSSEKVDDWRTRIADKHVPIGQRHVALTVRTMGDAADAVRQPVALNLFE